jgi:hypothetical protein
LKSSPKAPVFIGEAEGDGGAAEGAEGDRRCPESTGAEPQSNNSSRHENEQV